MPHDNRAAWPSPGDAVTVWPAPLCHSSGPQPLQVRPGGLTAATAWDKAWRHLRRTLQMGRVVGAPRGQGSRPGLSLTVVWPGTFPLACLPLCMFYSFFKGKLFANEVLCRIPMDKTGGGDAAGWEQRRGQRWTGSPCAGPFHPHCISRDLRGLRPHYTASVSPGSPPESPSSHILSF